MMTLHLFFLLVGVCTFLTFYQAKELQLFEQCHCKAGSAPLCACVPNDLCANNMVITDGSGKIDFRNFNRPDPIEPGTPLDNEADVCAGTLTCCGVPSTAQISPPKLSDLQHYESCACKDETIDQTCKCVPLILCKDSHIITDGNEMLDYRRISQFQKQRISIYHERQNECGSWSTCCAVPQKSRITTQKPKSPHECGRRLPVDISTRILNTKQNYNAQTGEFPWEAYIYKHKGVPNELTCGGSLIGSRVVITAAHCVQSNKPKDMYVILGVRDLHGDQDGFFIRDVVTHEKFNLKNGYNDIALLFLDTQVEFKPVINSICLPDPTDDFIGRFCQVTGWGKNSSDTDGTVQTVLKVASVPQVPKVECQSMLRKTRLGPYFELFNGFLCAGGEEGVDACLGDGGGPLACDVNGVFKLVGIVSWGIGCGQKDVPGVYIDVIQYLDWINQKVTEKGEKFIDFFGKN